MILNKEKEREREIRSMIGLFLYDIDGVNKLASVNEIKIIWNLHLFSNLDIYLT